MPWIDIAQIPGGALCVPDHVNQKHHLLSIRLVILCVASQIILFPSLSVTELNLSPNTVV